MNDIADNRPQPEATLKVGQLLDGKYRVDYLVGQGGMAVVWAGTSERARKRVALKVLLPSLQAIPGTDALFRREGLAASRVNHPNVVTVFDVIEHEGMACIVMELLDGEPLDRYLARQGPLSAGDACSFLLPAMRGVAAAHAEGVIHRDLKPQNIFVCIGPDGRVVTTKVLDFGISMLVGRAREHATGAAVPDITMGTPAYMAPEQLRGAGIDERADVYGFGVLCYEVLSGRLPFPGEPGLALYSSIMFDPAPPLAQFRPDLPAGLIRIVEIALAKEPSARFARLEDMVAALEAELPHALTPAGGVPYQVVQAGRSGRPAIPVEIARESAGEHQVTEVLVRFPRDAGAVHRLELAGASADLDRRVLAAARAGAPATLVRPQRWRNLRRCLHARRVRAWAGVGIALIVASLTFLGRRLASNGDSTDVNLAPLVVPAASPLLELPARIVVEPLPPEQRDGRSAAPESPSSSDGRDLAVSSAERRRGPRAVVDAAKRPRMTAAGNSPRATRLSVDDF